jgi:rhodanese-related sulfurtransferase
MMRVTRMLLLSMFVLALAACGGGDGGNGGQGQAAAGAAPVISGRIEEGLRVLTVDPTRDGEKFTIYRGDYVRMELASGEAFTVSIPALEIEKSFPPAEGDKPYFKVSESGVFPFQAAGVSGAIEAIEYVAASYREVNSQEAARFIAAEKPFILDVRTPGEFASGHLEGATLIPVQVLQQRMGQLAGQENEPLFIYCRTGNRSTVAAKLLNDAGFRNVVNLRRGIVEWQREGLPVVK